jgi:hypothetical protein
MAQALDEGHRMVGLALFVGRVLGHERSGFVVFQLFHGIPVYTKEDPGGSSLVKSVAIRDVPLMSAFHCIHHRLLEDTFIEATVAVTV